MATEYLDREDFKAYAGITGTTYDAVLDAILERVETIILTFAGRTNWTRDERVETYPGFGGDTIVLKHTPVLADSVTVKIVWPGTSDVTLNANDYEIDWDNGIIRLVRNGNASASWLSSDFPVGVVVPPVVERNFGDGLSNVEVTYTGGFATVPGDVFQCGYDLAQLLFNQRTRDLALQSERLGDYSYQIGSSQGGAAAVAGRSAIDAILSQYLKDYQRGAIL